MKFNRSLILSSNPFFSPMKLKFEVNPLHHDPAAFRPNAPKGITPIHRSFDPKLHGFLKQRESVRALNATKLEKLFAKPFVHAYEGHQDGISCLARGRKNLGILGSGSFDGEAFLWDLNTKSIAMKQTNAHKEGFTRGVVFGNDDSVLYSVGGDKKVMAWNINTSESKVYNVGMTSGTSIDYSWFLQEFVIACGDTMDFYDPLYSSVRYSFDLSRVSSLGQGSSMILGKYNPAESNILGILTSNNSILIYDTRSKTLAMQTQLNNKLTSLAFNPREPMNMYVSCMDGNAYGFDMRSMATAKNIYKGHVQGVLSLDVSPMGTQLATAGIDKTTRIFNLSHTNKSSTAIASYAMASEKAMEIYYTKRMQQIDAVQYSGDGRFLFTGSMDGNIRQWKSDRSRKDGVVSEREKISIEYRKRLIEKESRRNEEVKLISQHRHVPRFIKNQGKQRSDMFTAAHKKEANRAENEKSFTKRNDKQKIVRNLGPEQKERKERT
jgi:DDB1- and CUL4-associated factor 13